MPFADLCAVQSDNPRADEWIVGSLHLAAVQQLSTGTGVVIGLIDTGVQAAHQDLKGSILPGIDLSTGTPIGNGWKDADGHGTRMAGLIVGHGHGQNAGILGVAPGARVLPIRTGNRDDIGFLPDAIEYAIAHGVSVLSISAGASGTDVHLNRALHDAMDADVVVVASVGNAPGDRFVLYPAAFPGVVAVGGTDEHGDHASMSVIGAPLSLCAPATNIVSTQNDGAYSYGSGTSDATAIVAGAVALVRSHFPHMSADEIVHRLEATAIDKGALGRDSVYGYGTIDIVAALTANVSPRARSSPAESGVASPAPLSSHAQDPGIGPARREGGRRTSLYIIGAALIVALVGAGVMQGRRAK